MGMTFFTVTFNQTVGGELNSVVVIMSLDIFLFGNAYSGLFLKPFLIVLLFFLPTVFHCRSVFGPDFFCGPVVLILVIGGGSASVLLLFFLLLSVSWRSLAWFRVRFRKVVFFFVVCLFSIDLHFVNV